MSLRALFAPQGEGLEVKVQGQLAEWPQKPRLPLSTSDPFVHTSMQQQRPDQFAAFGGILILTHFNCALEWVRRAPPVTGVDRANSGPARRVTATEGGGFTCRSQ